jgi:hypothetical protein
MYTDVVWQLFAVMMAFGAAILIVAGAVLLVENRRKTVAFRPVNFPGRHLHHHQRVA